MPLIPPFRLPSLPSHCEQVLLSMSTIKHGIPLCRLYDYVSQSLFTKPHQSLDLEPFSSLFHQIVTSNHCLNYFFTSQLSIFGDILSALGAACRHAGPLSRPVLSPPVRTKALTAKGKRSRLFGRLHLIQQKKLPIALNPTGCFHGTFTKNSGL